MSPTKLLQLLNMRIYIYILPSITYVNGMERGLLLMYVIKCAASVLPVNLTVASLFGNLGSRKLLYLS